MARVIAAFKQRRVYGAIATVVLIASAGFLAAMVLSEPGDVVRALIGGFTGAAALDAWRRVMRKSL